VCILSLQLKTRLTPEDRVIPAFQVLYGLCRVFTEIISVVNHEHTESEADDEEADALYVVSSSQSKFRQLIYAINLFSNSEKVRDSSLEITRPVLVQGPLVLFAAGELVFLLIQVRKL
jgi:hypothetical protein